MNRVPYYTVSLTTGTTLTTLITVEKWDQLILYVPGMSTVAGSGIITASLLVSYNAASAATGYYYDYVSNAPRECKITMSTSGAYEIPNMGGANAIQIKFDVAATQATTCYLMTPKTTF